MEAGRVFAIIGVLAGTLPRAPADGVDYPIECSGAAVDAAIDAAIGEAAAGPVRAVLSPGTCLIASTHQLNGAISFDIVGAGAASTTLQGQGIAMPLFLVGGMSGGVDFGLRALTLRHAPLNAIAISDSALRLDAVQFSGNTSGAAAIVAESSSVTIANSRFEGNAGDSGTIRLGGGPAGNLSVVDTAFVDNVVAGDGGAIRANVSVTLDRVLFSGNTAANGFGGAIYMSEFDLSVRNSTFTANAAAYGGAIAQVAEFESKGAALRNVTLHGDTASASGSEIYSGGSNPPPIAIFNSLVGGTCGGSAGATSAHGSIESPGDTCALSVADNRVGVADDDLHLGALAANGGATPTLYPGPGSVLIDAAGADCEGVDERDRVRDVGGCDVGSVEAGATRPDGLFGDGFGG